MQCHFLTIIFPLLGGVQEWGGGARERRGKANQQEASGAVRGPYWHARVYNSPFSGAGARGGVGGKKPRYPRVRPGVCSAIGCVRYFETATRRACRRLVFHHTAIVSRSRIAISLHTGPPLAVPQGRRRRARTYARTHAHFTLAERGTKRAQAHTRLRGPALQRKRSTRHLLAAALRINSAAHQAMEGRHTPTPPSCTSYMYTPTQHAQSTARFRRSLFRPV